MRTATLELYGDKYHVYPQVSEYQVGHATAVELVEVGTDEPFCSLSVNFRESLSLPKGAFYAKHWSENETIVEQLLAQDVIEPVPAPPMESGFVSNIRAYRLKE